MFPTRKTASKGLRGGGCRGQGGDRAELAGSSAPLEFYTECGGSHGGFFAEEGCALTQEVPSTLGSLCREQGVGDNIQGATVGGDGTIPWWRPVRSRERTRGLAEVRATRLADRPGTVVEVRMFLFVPPLSLQQTSQSLSSCVTSSSSPSS